MTKNPYMRIIEFSLVLMAVYLAVPATLFAIEGVGSNPDAVYEIAAADNQVWAGWDQRIFYSDNSGLSWNYYYSENGFQGGAVSSMFVNDTNIWVATYKDTTINNVEFFLNSGLYTSQRDAMNWQFITVPHQSDAGNIIYDICVDNTALWTANWWRAVQKSSNGGLDWELVIPDTATFFNPWDNLMHRVFSVRVDSGSIWVGTQNGISLSVDSGMTWDYIHAGDGPQSISGNKIVALEFRDVPQGREIWAATWTTFNPGERYGTSVSRDSGKTWEILLPDEQVWNFLFNDDDIFIAGRSGLWYSHDQGVSFSNLTASLFLAEVDIYDIAMTSDSILWIGTENGLYRGDYYGNSWQKVDFITLDTDDDPSAIPRSFTLGVNYPNPFNPRTTIPVTLKSAGMVDLGIFDILGRRVRTLVSGNETAGDHEFIWDGSDNGGNPLPSGVYFYRLSQKDETYTRSMILMK